MRQLKSTCLKMAVSGIVTQVKQNQRLTALLISLIDVDKTNKFG
jgi:hypothetical protein